ncbi:MAG: regulatory protein GemA [Proteobacteria bacterium]|nr:regulatory protein GemA [Pseudomonadota bacterium]
MSSTAPKAVAVITATARADQRRRTRIQAISVSRRQLGLDEDTYRAMLVRLTGKRSIKDMTEPEHKTVLDHLRQAGAVHPLRQDREARLRRPRPDAVRADMMGKVHALLDELGRATGQPHTLTYADAVCKRNRWASCADLCTPDHLHALVGALSRTLRAKAGKAAA